MKIEILPNKKKKHLFSIIILAIIICSVCSYFYYFKQKQNKKISGAMTYLPSEHSLVKGNASAVLGQTDAKTNNSGEQPILLSENFKMGQLTVNSNSNVANIGEFEESDILKINNIKSELYSIKEGDKDTNKAIISCNTTKRANIEVDYIKSGEKEVKTVNSEFYGMDHTIIISGLDPDSVYKYSVNAIDLVGNKVTSDQFVFYTGAPNVSLMTVLENATQKVFGWAMKK